MLKGWLIISVGLFYIYNKGSCKCIKQKGIFRYYVNNKTWFLFVCLSIGLVLKDGPSYDILSLGVFCPQCINDVTSYLGEKKGGGGKEKGSGIGEAFLPTV